MVNRKFEIKGYKNKYRGEKVIVTFVGTKEELKQYLISNRIVTIAQKEQGTFEDKYNKIEYREW